MARTVSTYNDIEPGDTIVLDGMIYGVVENNEDQMYPERRILLIQIMSHYVRGCNPCDSNSMYINPHKDDVVTKWNGVVWRADKR